MTEDYTTRLMLDLGLTTVNELRDTVAIVRNMPGAIKMAFFDDESIPVCSDVTSVPIAPGVFMFAHGREVPLYLTPISEGS